MAMINAGGKIDPGSVEAVKDAILAILGASADQITIQRALITFESTCPSISANNSVITNCTLSGGDKTERTD